MSESRTKLQAARRAEGWPQARLMMLMKAMAPQADLRLPSEASLKTELSRWENGHKTPEACYRKLFRIIYGLTDEELGFPTDSASLVPCLALPVFSHPVVDYYARMFRDHIRADSQMGPRYVLPVVEQQVKTLVPLVRELRGEDRRSAVDLVCRYEEFLGWLYQDSGQPELAVAWTSRAHDLGLELSDPRTTSYLLMRRSNIATDAGDPAQALALAEAALREHAGVNGSTKAVILRQKANACAALGDERGCASAIDAAFEALALPDESPDQASYCTTQYVAMEGGTCWLTLNKPERALTTFAEADDIWPEASRRDHGLFMARLAIAYTANGDL